MKKIYLFPILLLMLLLFPQINVYAAEYIMQNGKTVKGTYSGEENNYYKIVPSKNSFICIKAVTSDGQPLQLNICDEEKNKIASDIEIENKKTVYHKVKKGQILFLEIKGKENVDYSISYKIEEIEKLKYAKKYSYTLTNASFSDKTNAILLKMKSSQSGNLHFMCNSNSEINVQYLNSKKKEISDAVIMSKNSLSGVGVEVKKVYYVKLWNNVKDNSGTTSLKNIKYQIKSVGVNNNSSRGRAYTLSKAKEELVVAGKKNEFWYKIKLNQKKKLSLSIESRLLQNNGKNLALDLYNGDGKKITSKSIVIEDQAYSTYKNKKYIMHYPKKKIVTGELPEGVYYVRFVSGSKKTSGSFRIILN